MPSTGPKTVEGKLRSARNALKHGLLSTRPVLPDESPEAWEAHQASVLRNLAPLGPVETLLAERAALLMWRLQRIPRFESELAALRHQSALNETNIRVEFGGSRVALTLPQLSSREKSLREDLRRLKALPTWPDAQQLEPAVAARLLERVAVAAGWTRERLACLRYPGLVSHNEIERLPGWTAARLRVCAALLAKPARRPLHQVLEIAALALAADLARLRAAKPLLRERIEEMQRRRILDAPDLEKVSRYESHLHRQLTGTLHELEAIQHRRRASAAASSKREQEEDTNK